MASAWRSAWRVASVSIKHRWQWQPVVATTAAAVAAGVVVLQCSSGDVASKSGAAGASSDGFMTLDGLRGQQGNYKVVGYVSDVEGNIEYWKRYVNLSAVLDFDKAAAIKPGHLPPVTLRSGTAFVFGGDCFDQGPGDLRVGAQLVDLKRRYPDRVFLIIGNRDINKTKLSSELHPSDVLDRRVDDHPGPFWVPESKRVRPLDYLKQRLVDEYGKRTVGQWSPEHFQRMLARENTIVNRLRYLYIHTMGCPHTFEYRRQELAMLAGHNDPTQISDADVLQSVVDSVAPRGIVTQYLQSAQLGVILNDTLFVHGAVHGKNFGFMPSKDTKDDVQVVVPGEETASVWSVDHWITALNVWAAWALAEWRLQPLWNADRTHRGGAPLHGYAYKPTMLGRSVMVENMFIDDPHTPQPPQGRVINYLQRGGVNRLIVGHKPFADSPTVMRAVGGFETVLADTSYSDSRSPDRRGTAISETCVLWDGHGKTRTWVHGELKDGTPVDFKTPWVPHKAGGDSSIEGGGECTIGKRTAKGELIVAKVSKDGGAARYVVRQGKPGYVIEQRTVAGSEVAGAQLHQPKD